MMVLLVALAAHAVDRETALDNAAAYAVHEWTMTSVNETASCSSEYASTYDPGTWRGLPYDWGGYMTIAEYDDQLASGYGAGSHSWHGILSCTAGLDCSGFVSKVWGIGHYSTSTFHNAATDISIGSVKRADAFNDAGSHMVLHTYETAAGAPVFYEASGGADKTRLNSTSGWSYLSGYQAIRSDTITDGPSSGTTLAPRDILAFPFEDFRWTAGAASDLIDSYSCAPDTDESGPEMLYRFVAATSGTLHVVVGDDSGVDVDVHVLTAPSGDACLARHDSEVSVEVGPGEVWIALDTYVGSREFPGPYVLNATFTGDVGVPDDTDPVDTGTEDTDDGVADDVDEFGGDRPVGDDDDDGEGPRRVIEEQGRMGCGCAAMGNSAGWIALLPGILLLGRRRRG